MLVIRVAGYFENFRGCRGAVVLNRDRVLFAAAGHLYPTGAVVVQVSHYRRLSPGHYLHCILVLL